MGTTLGSGIAVDDPGNAYVTGDTISTDFPTVNAVQPAFGGGDDAFVAKLNRNGSQLLYSTYLGGSGSDEGFGIAVDDPGNAYVTGTPFRPTSRRSTPCSPPSGAVKTPSWRS